MSSNNGEQTNSGEQTGLVRMRKDVRYLIEVTYKGEWHTLCINEEAQIYKTKKACTHNYNALTRSKHK